MYNCSVCDFSTNNKYDFNKHLSTIKHKTKTESECVCKQCFKVYSNKYNTARHEKQCIQNITNNNTTNENHNKAENNGDGVAANILGNHNTIKNNPVTNITVNLSSDETVVLQSLKITELLKKTTDKVDKLILECMIESDSDITNFVSNFDEQLRYRMCDMERGHDICIENKTSENCVHASNYFKLSEASVVDSLKKALLNVSEDIVMTHKLKNLSGKKTFLFKLIDVLCYKDALKIFFDKSKYRDNINIDASVDYLDNNQEFAASYENYYKSLRFRAKKIINQKK